MEQSLNYSEQVITPEIAREYLQTNKVNRTLRLWKVREYALQMKAGKWKMSGECICFLKGGALGNGQHRLWAVIESNTPTKFGILRNCDPDSFTTYDSGLGRSLADALHIQDINNSSTIGSIISRYFALCNNIYGDGRRGGVASRLGLTRDDYIAEYNSSPKLYQDACMLAKRLNKRLSILKPADIGGIYIYLVKYCNHKIDMVAGFFNDLHSPTPRHSSTAILREKLIADKISRTKMLGEYKYNLIAKSWNSCTTQKPIKQLKWSESEGQIKFI